MGGFLVGVPLMFGGIVAYVNGYATPAIILWVIGYILFVVGCKGLNLKL